MICYFVRVDTVLMQRLWHRVIKRFQWSPRPMQEVVPARVHFSAAWHARHRADLGRGAQSVTASLGVMGAAGRAERNRAL